MNFLLIFFGIFNISLHAAFAASHPVALSIRSDYKLSNEPLTTEKVWKLDPHQSNPHLQRWVVSRQVELEGLKVVPLKNGKYGVTATGLFSQAEGYIREKGPWFLSLDDFPCEKQPDSWFETQEGAKLGASIASEVWTQVLGEEKIKLEYILGRVVGDTPKSAIDLANRAYAVWLKNVEEEWRIKAHEKAKAQVWKYYLEQATAQGKCNHNKSSSKVTSQIWKSMMEPITGNPPSISQVLARAPARLWNGLFTVRLNVKAGGRTLNGRFLIDSGANHSVISPYFLESQGIYPAWVKVPNAPPQRIIWSDLWGGEMGLAPVVWIESVEMSGLTLPLNEFLLAETDFFSPPDNISSCCDGILGDDFIKLFPIEFQSRPPSEVRVWPREGFHWTKDTPWVEVIESTEGNIVSSCTTSPGEKNRKRPEVILPGASWDMGSEEALRIHLPWQKLAEKIVPNAWSIHCESLEIAKDVHADFPKAPAGESSVGPLAARIPAVNIGIGILSRGNFTFDLPHGRLWFEKGSLSRPPPGINRSGLVLEYVMVLGDRILRVKSIQPGSRAHSLIKEGVRKGTVITQINGRDVSDMDLWEVQRRLAGDYGNTVNLQWQTKKGLKMAALVVKE